MTSHTFTVKQLPHHTTQDEILRIIPLVIMVLFLFLTSANILPAGRWFAGMGVGGLSVVVPMFNAELAPASIRGTLVGLQQVAICCMSYTTP